MTTTSGTSTRKTTPGDHKAPAEERYFTFTHEGTEYTLPEPISKITAPGFIRKNRRRDEVDLGFTALEALAGQTKAGLKCLDAIDNMSLEQFNQVMEDLWEFADVPQGE